MRCAAVTGRETALPTALAALSTGMVIVRPWSWWPAPEDAVCFLAPRVVLEPEPRPRAAPPVGDFAVVVAARLAVGRLRRAAVVMTVALLLAPRTPLGELSPHYPIWSPNVLSVMHAAAGPRPAASSE